MWWPNPIHCYILLLINTLPSIPLKEGDRPFVNFAGCFPLTSHFRTPSLPPWYVAGALPRARGPGVAKAGDILRSLALARVDVVVADAPMGASAWEPKHQSMAGPGRTGDVWGYFCFNSTSPHQKDPKRVWHVLTLLLTYCFFYFDIYHHISWQFLTGTTRIHLILFDASLTVDSDMFCAGANYSGILFEICQTFHAMFILPDAHQRAYFPTFY